MTLQSLVKWQLAQEGHAPLNKKRFVENVHFYLEDGKVVFTDLYHKERGSCCGKKCRHCPFVPKYEKGNKKLNN